MSAFSDLSVFDVIKSNTFWKLSIIAKLNLWCYLKVRTTQVKIETIMSRLVKTMIGNPHGGQGCPRFWHKYTADLMLIYPKMISMMKL